MKYSRLFSVFLLIPVVAYLFDYGTNFLGYAAAFFSRLEGSALLLHIVALIFFLMHILGKGPRCEGLGEGAQLFYLGFIAVYSYLDEDYYVFFIPLFLLIIFVAVYYDLLDKYRLLLSSFLLTASGIFLFLRRGESFTFMILCFFPAFYLALVYQKSMRFQEILDDRESRWNGEVSYLREQLIIKEKNIDKLKRPKYYGECHLTQADKGLLDSMRILESSNTKELAVFMERSEHTINNNISRMCKKLGFPGRRELFAYVMLSIPDITE